MIKTLLTIVYLGYGILIIALLINFLASKIGAISWYDLLKNGSSISALNYVWLFVGYPLALGVGIYLILKVVKII